jgi:twinkle protein
MRQHLPCPCGSSSDAYTEYPTGGYCFSCGKKFFHDKDTNLLETKPAATKAVSTTTQIMSHRGHSKETAAFFGIKHSVDEEGNVVTVWYPYSDGAILERDTKTKAFKWHNYTKPGLAGAEKFSAASAKAITITEGAEDMQSVYEMLGSKYPVVSVTSASSAMKDCAAKKDFLNSFDRIYLCFDNDAPGKKAVIQVSSLFPFDKIYVVDKTRFKDANEYQLNGATEEYRRLWYNAKRHDPENVVSSFTDLASIFKQPKKKAICTFPFTTLQEMTLGIRTGETYLYKAQEGIGKTELFGAIEHHFVKNTDFPVGLIHLEEDVQRTAMRFVNYEVKEPVHLEGFTKYDNDAIFEVYKKIAGRDNRLHFYKKGKNDNDTDAFLAAIRFMVASAGCRALFFDHVTRLATSFRLEDERKELDYVSTKLSEMAEELDFSLHMISAVNDEGLTRGSRNLSKEAWTVINLKRDKMSQDTLERNTTYLEIEKNRHASFTGPAGRVFFDPSTFILSETPPKLLPEV